VQSNAELDLDDARMMCEGTRSLSAAMKEKTAGGNGRSEGGGEGRRDRISEAEGREEEKGTYEEAWEGEQRKEEDGVEDGRKRRKPRRRKKQLDSLRLLNRPPETTRAMK